MQLSDEERFALGGEAPPWLSMAMRIVVEAGRLAGAARLVPVTSAHVDGCLYHGDAGVHFVERLAALGGRVTVPTSLNVGALDLIHPEVVRAEPRVREMAGRQMRAYEQLGCAATWTCAPYQVGYRPALGEHVAWAESNAVVFANSVLGARSNRNGDFLDICCALAGRAPCHGLHLDAGRVAVVRVDLSPIAPALLAEDAFYPVLGAWLGAEVGSTVSVLDGLPAGVSEDRLKALGAGAASTGAVGLFHAAGVTPEAPDLVTAGGGEAPARTVRVTPEMVRAARDALTTSAGDALDCVALGSPHFSAGECRALAAALDGRHRPRHPGRPRGGARAPRGGRRHLRDRHLRGGHPRAGGRRRRDDDQLGQVCPLRTGQHRLRRGVRLPVGLRGVGGRGPGQPGRGPVAVTLAGRVLIPGDAQGPLLRLGAPISFWGGVDPGTGRITQPRHPDHGRSVAGTVLALPGTIGSSSSSAVLLELVHAGRAPRALLLAEADAILVLGVVVAREMGYGSLPVVECDVAALPAADAATVRVSQAGPVSLD
jgi:predicted aconitase/predicted aconitase with swiveling domain